MKANFTKFFFCFFLAFFEPCKTGEIHICNGKILVIFNIFLEIRVIVITSECGVHGFGGGDCYKIKKIPF